MPDEARTVVVNTAPLISLSLLSRLDLLRDLYEQVLIPPAVRSEALRGGVGGVGVTDLQRADWIVTVALKDPARADLLLSDLDRGEAEVLALGQERQADLVIIDERLGRRHARRLGLPLTGTLGVLLRAKRQGLVSEISPLVAQIHRGGIWLSKALIAEALKLAGEG